MKSQSSPLVGIVTTPWDFLQEVYGCRELRTLDATILASQKDGDTLRLKLRIPGSMKEDDYEDHVTIAPGENQDLFARHYVEAQFVPSAAIKGYIDQPVIVVYSGKSVVGVQPPLPHQHVLMPVLGVPNNYHTSARAFRNVEPVSDTAGVVTLKVALDETLPAQNAEITLYDGDTNCDLFYQLYWTMYNAVGADDLIGKPVRAFYDGPKLIGLQPILRKRK